MSTNHPIPESVEQDDLLAAIKPLCDLLHVTPRHFYDLTIDAGRIRLTVPAVDGEAEWDIARPPEHLGEFTPQGASATAATLMQRIDISVLIDGESA